MEAVVQLISSSVP